eukprot:3296058-Prymnesium_polylepis.1
MPCMCAEPMPLSALVLERAIIRFFFAFIFLLQAPGRTVARAPFDAGNPRAIPRASPPGRSQDLSATGPLHGFT